MSDILFLEPWKKFTDNSTFESLFGEMIFPTYVSTDKNLKKKNGFTSFVERDHRPTNIKIEQKYFLT